MIVKLQNKFYGSIAHMYRIYGWLSLNYRIKCKINYLKDAIICQLLDHPTLYNGIHGWIGINVHIVQRYYKMSFYRVKFIKKASDIELKQALS